MAAKEEHKEEHAPKKNLGAAWADQMRDKYEHNATDREKIVDHRVEDAQAFVGKEVTKMKGWIKKTGKQNDKGQYTVEYGPLFSAVQGDMQALSSTLKTARRLGVVGFEGEHLMQGRDDHVVITLLDDSDKKYQIVVSDKGDHAKTEEKDPFAIDAQTHTISPCSRCKVEVMPLDRVGVAGQVLHRKCFECYLPECTLQLTPSRYASITVDGQMRFYCVAHYKQLYTVNADYEKGFQQGKSGTGAASLHLVSEHEQAAMVKQSHDRVKEALARKQIAENDLAKMDAEKKETEEKKKTADATNLSNKLASAGLGPK